MADTRVQVYDNRTHVTVAGAELIRPIIDRAIQTARDEVAKIAGRASLYGITDEVKAQQFIEASFEADFVEDYFRSGYTTLESEADGPGWIFARASSGTAEADGGSIASFTAGQPRVTNRGLLIEGRAVQMAKYSSDFDSWSKSNVAVTAGGTDYVGAAAKRVTVSTDGAAVLQMTGTGSGLATGNCAWFVVKKGSGATQGNQFTLYNATKATVPVGIDFDYDTGEITYRDGTSGASATPLGSGWWLLALSATAGIDNGDALTSYAGFVGNTENAAEYFFISHAQIENRPHPTSRIVNNSGSAAAREADIAQIGFSAAGDFTVFAEVEMGDHVTEEALFSIDSGAATNRLTVLRVTSGAIRLQAVINNSQAVAQITGKGGRRVVRTAIVSRASSTRISLDGGPVFATTTNRPPGLSRLLIGQSSTGQHLDGNVRRLLVLDRAVSDTDLRAMTKSPDIASLSEAPLIGHPLQGRFNPIANSTPDGDYGRLPVVVYGQLPCDLLIAEMKGPSALAIAADGNQMFRDTQHLGRWIDVDPLTKLCLVGKPDYRTIRWLDRSGQEKFTWTLPGGIDGEIYGLRTNGVKMVINTADGTDGETHIWELDANGVPTGSPVVFTAFAGANKLSRGLRIVGNTLWIASMLLPSASEGTGALQAYDLISGTLLQSYFGHYPNDVDLSPNGEIIFADEHLDRIRAVDPVAETVRTVMAGLEVRANFEGQTTINANQAATATTDGSGLEAAAVEYRGIKGLYAPNGVSVIGEGLYAIADTDNGRVVVARQTETWEPEIVAIIAPLNEPTKVRVIPTSN